MKSSKSKRAAQRMVCKTIIFSHIIDNILYNLDLIHNWTESTASVSEASKNLCPPAENITDVNKRVADVNNEFKLLCLGVLEWSDCTYVYSMYTVCTSGSW